MQHPDIMNGQKLPPWNLTLVKIGMPVGLILMIVGGCGIFVLTDEDKKWSITNSQFGQLYQQLSGINPMFTAVFVNGGMLLFFLCTAKYWNHNKAVDAIAKQEEALRKQKEDKEPKKTK
eukprot:TRINITY_DN9584_c0_g1_i1.p4 TRINITY_DN9584_c0_g1~~TRINITY_DN9584_c0_g1_i1.p4  ORF type:complete len:119 (-),score=14.60 TRINITY_DN9584_c0_g1_i1:452-808(-)